jgi:hypothetical protein
MSTVFGWIAAIITVVAYYVGVVNHDNVVKQDQSHQYPLQPAVVQQVGAIQTDGYNGSWRNATMVLKSDPSNRIEAAMSWQEKVGQTELVRVSPRGVYVPRAVLDKGPNPITGSTKLTAFLEAFFPIPVLLALLIGVLTWWVAAGIGRTVESAFHKLTGIPA